MVNKNVSCTSFPSSSSPVCLSSLNLHLNPSLSFWRSSYSYCHLSSALERLASYLVIAALIVRYVFQAEWLHCWPVFTRLSLLSLPPTLWLWAPLRQGLFLHQTWLYVQGSDSGYRLVKWEMKKYFKFDLNLFLEIQQKKLRYHLEEAVSA